MEGAVELEQLLMSRDNYGKYLPSVVKAIQTSRNKFSLAYSGCRPSRISSCSARTVWDWPPRRKPNY